MSSGISDVLARISQIEQQLQALTGAAPADAASDTTGSTGSTSTSSSSGTSSSDFSDALAQAQASAASVTDPTASGVDSPYGSLADSSLASPTTVGSTDSTDALSALASLSGVTGATSSGATLPSSASTLLTSSQQQFASTLSADTGLNPSVVTSWMLAEESGSAAQSRQAAGNNDWLNIGYTDSGTYGASDSVWSDPTTAANATAQWLQGQDSIAGYGTASSGIQSILQSVGQTPAAQIQAIQESGWSSGGYSSLPTLYNQVVGAA